MESKQIFIATKYLIYIIAPLFAIMPLWATEPPKGALLEGVVLDDDGNPLACATIFVDGTSRGTVADAEGRYTLYVDPGKADVVVQMLGYTTEVHNLDVVAGVNAVDFTLDSEATDVGEVVVSASGVGRLRRSAFNAIALDAKALQNTTQNISDALSRAPGLKLRESGGVGSDMSLMVDGFSGKHVKVFIDGVPQEGVGGAFSLNNIPAGYAERIEVYRGVVPVGFGADALGGVINIVTNKSRRLCMPMPHTPMVRLTLIAPR